MNDNRTEFEKYDAWVKAVSHCWKCGWRCVYGWVFRSPSGSLHDLSAADLESLWRVERFGLFPADDQAVKWRDALARIAELEQKLSDAEDKIEEMGYELMESNCRE